MDRSGKTSAKRVAAYGMAAVFAAVGGIFLAAPGSVISFFNSLSDPLGMRPAPASGPSLYTALAAAYMYMVTFLAWNMARRPEEEVFPRLLVQAKLASAFVSFGLFLVSGPWLVFLANGVVDGLIGAGVHVLFRRNGTMGRTRPREA
jgi:hypothetical protein